MDQDANLTRLADSFGFLVTRLARAMEHDFETRLADLGMSRTMWAVLASVALDGKELPSEIAGNIGLDRSIVTRQLARGRERGWLRFETNPTDGRSKRIRLTQQGHSVFLAAKACSEATNTLFLDGICADQAARLKESIGEILNGTEPLTRPL